MMSPKSLKQTAPIGIWLVGVAFVLFQFFLQLSSGIVIDSIMHDLRLTALTAGMLSSSLYIVYTFLQIPVGILFDHKNTKQLMTMNALLCSLGCVLFAGSHSLIGLFLGRMIIGVGASFAFVGLVHLVRQHFPVNRFAFMIGLSETLAFFATVIGIIVLGTVITHWGWRGFILIAGLVGFIITYCCWTYLPNSPPPYTMQKNLLRPVLQILKNKTAWINGLFVGLSFTVVTVFGALWSVPFIQIKLMCNLQQASFLTALFFLGTGLSCPLFGLIAAKLEKRKPLMLSSCLATTGLLMTALYAPINSQILMATVLFLMGLCCGSYMLAYTISNELAPEGAISTCAGFTNSLAIITTPILQPFVGYLLDEFSTSNTYTLQDYQGALLVVPISMLVATLLVFFLPEKNRERCIAYTHEFSVL